MQSAIDAFRGCLQRVQHLGGLHDAVSSLTTSAVDASDLLRAQIVLTVSALDYYIHEVTVLGMVETFENKRPATEAFKKFRVSAGVLMPGPVSSATFASEIRERHSYLSFQQPDKIADAIRLISDIAIWKEVATAMACNEKSVKDQLKLIVDRRNKIAHEADLDPSFPGSRWPITKADVQQSSAFVGYVGEAIHVKIT